VEYCPKIEIIDNPQVVEVVDLATKASSSGVFDDPMRDQQWHYYNNGKVSSSVSGCDINVVPVWKNYSTYYKYKDFILEPSEMSVGRKAVLSVMLSHEPGVLSAVLAHISELGGSVLTITQSLHIHGKASVTLTLDTSGMPGALNQLMEALAKTPGAENPKLIAVE
jgi:chorismate mutase